MSDAPETIADIVAKKRAQAAQIAAKADNQFARELVDDIRREADRLEAASARERSRLEEMLNLAQMQVQAMEEKRNAMNRLYTLTVAVRKAQNTYFAKRTEENLRASKAAERNLDDFLLSLLQLPLGI